MTTLFKDKEFCIINGTTSYPKVKLETMVVEVIILLINKVTDKGMCQRDVLPINNPFFMFDWTIIDAMVGKMTFVSEQCSEKSRGCPTCVKKIGGGRR